MKKVLSLLLALILVLTACGEGGGTTTADSANHTTAVVAPRYSVNLGLLAGPTGMGAAKLLQEAEVIQSLNHYNYTLFNAPDEVTAKLISGELDIAAVPTNLAAVLYQKTKGGVQLLALNTLGVLHLVSSADNVIIRGVEDLVNQTIYSSGQGAVPEYVLNYLLDSYGIRDKVTVVYEAEHDAVVAALASGKAKIAVLPEPKVTAALMQVEGLRNELDLTLEWNRAAEKAGAAGSILSMGCVVVRTEYAKENPQPVQYFLREYQASIEYMKDSANLDRAADLCEKFGIIPKAAVAKKAMAGANLCFVSGEEMKAQIAPFYQILFNYNPASVGGALPDDGFYYGK